MNYWNSIRHIVTQGGIPFALFFLALFTTLWPYNPAFALLFIFSTTFVLLEEAKRLDITTGMLMAYSVIFLLTFLAHDYNKGIAHKIGYLLGPATVYLFGRNIVAHMRKESDVYIMLIICIIGLGSFVFINVLLDIVINGTIVNLSRTMVTPIGGWKAKATLYGMCVAPSLVGLGCFATLPHQWRNPVAWFMLLLALLGIMSVTHFLNRTGIMVLGLTTVAMIGYQSRGRTGTMVATLVLIALLVALIIGNGIIDQEWIDAYSSRESSGYESSSLGGRLERWTDAIHKMWDYPTGWANNPATFSAFAHNLWLDVMRIAGVVPFTILVGCTLPALWTTVRLFMLKRNNALIALLIGLHGAMFASCFVEPVTEGAQTFMFFYFFIWAVQYEVYDRMTSDPTFVQDTDRRSLTPAESDAADPKRRGQEPA